MCCNEFRSLMASSHIILGSSVWQPWQTLQQLEDLDGTVHCSISGLSPDWQCWINLMPQTQHRTPSADAFACSIPIDVSFNYTFVWKLKIPLKVFLGFHDPPLGHFLPLLACNFLSFLFKVLIQLSWRLQLLKLLCKFQLPFVSCWKRQKNS